LGYKESLQRDIDGTKALLLPNLLKSCLIKVSTDRTKLNTDNVEEGTAEPEPRESTSSAAQTTPTPTPTTFGDDETIA
ncbi:hypothetical protein Tco_1049858, partial [Tanacetum coccineum]